MRSNSHPQSDSFGFEANKTRYNRFLKERADELENSYQESLKKTLGRFQLELADLSNSFPTSENIERFEFLCQEIKKHYNNPTANEFKKFITQLETVYTTSSSSKWKLIAANNIFLMYHNTFTDNEHIWNNPSYHKCVEWAHKVNGVEISDKERLSDDEKVRDYKSLTIHWPEHIQRKKSYFENMTQTYKNEIETTYDNLVALVKSYREEDRHDEESLGKYKTGLFNTFHDILNETGKSKYDCIKKFNNELQNVNESLVGEHRTESWKRFFLDAMSFLAILIPAAWRAISSYSKYGTIDFTEPESKRAINYAKENISNLFKLFPDKKEELNKKIEVSVEQNKTITLDV